MPIPVASLAGTPYVSGSIGVDPGPPAAQHRLYTLAQARVQLNVTPHPSNVSMRRLGGAVAPLGDTIYLKFYNNKITSVRLPVPAPAGVDFFFTENMTGCKFYVDTIAGSNDLIVYHANTTAHGPGIGANADVQTVAAGNVLDNLHTAAQGDYAPAVPHNAASLAKPAYFASAGNEERRKTLQGRIGAQFAGGCTIVGFPQANTWDFHYQTWGDVEYARPTGRGTVVTALFTFHWNYLRKRMVEGSRHDVSYGTMDVLESGQFY
jgi:hypothetical protein